MRLELKPWQLLTVAAAGAAALVVALTWLHPKPVKQDADMVALLPHDGETILYANVAVLQHAGLPDLFASSAEEPEYRQFLSETHFDYTKDIDALAAAMGKGEFYFVVRGRFDWPRLERYANSHGGTCVRGSCSAPTSKPGRWASYFPIQSNVMALAVSTNRNAAAILRPGGQQRDVSMSPQPVWVSVSPALLNDPTAFPAPVEIFTSALAQARHVLLSVGGDGTDWSIQLVADCDSPVRARLMRDSLEERTSLLRRAFNRTHQDANATGLTGMIVDGSFRLAENKVLGIWPLRKAFLDSLRQ
ncbi:MAG TPA: hypothetical protein VH325_12415 [Bryobacteraceae bacterium]|nr:hypothetical protein [Bryobacteraceae bacterium]